jgi:hypothetical protein
MHKDTFNADFYVAAATVIPILYLALTLQGQTFERIASSHQRLHDIPKKERDWRWSILDAILIAAGWIIPACGIIGEILALLGLLQRPPSNGTASTIMIFLIILLVAVGAGPLLRFRDMVSERREGPKS